MTRFREPASSQAIDFALHPTAIVRAGALHWPDIAIRCCPPETAEPQNCPGNRSIVLLPVVFLQSMPVNPTKVVQSAYRVPLRPCNSGGQMALNRTMPYLRHRLARQYARDRIAESALLQRGYRPKYWRPPIAAVARFCPTARRYESARSEDHATPRAGS